MLPKKQFKAKLCNIAIPCNIAFIVIIIIHYLWTNLNLKMQNRGMDKQFEKYYFFHYCCCITVDKSIEQKWDPDADGCCYIV